MNYWTIFLFFDKFIESHYRVLYWFATRMFSNLYAALNNKSYFVETNEKKSGTSSLIAVN